MSPFDIIILSNNTHLMQKSLLKFIITIRFY